MCLSVYKTDNAIVPSNFIDSYGYIKPNIYGKEVNLVDVYMDDEKNFYRLVAFDILVKAWKEYARTVESQSVVLREHGFTELEIQILIESSRK